MNIQTSTLKTTQQSVSTKNILRKAIQIALAGSALASSLSIAQLQDHGPATPVINYPQWYRDTNGLALGLCRSTSQYCFPLAANPKGFAGNIGDEVFYNLVEFVNTTTGSDFQFRYLGALEASYLPGPSPVKGTETVFARIRITFNFNDPNKNGTYVVTHPFGQHTFTNVQATAKTNLIGSQAANFFTVDVPLGLGFEDALNGPIGPFIQWDTDLPLSVGTPGAADYEEFVGDPTLIGGHTFTGSPFGTNFIEIQGPVGSNLDGLADPANETFEQLATHDKIKMTLANVLGQKWTQPIATALKVDSAVKTRSDATASAGKNGIDVWATSVANQDMIVTGNGMPSLQLTESPTIPGKYHGHIEYDVAQPVPAQVQVTNLTSKPVASVIEPLKDIVEISKATYNTVTHNLTVAAHSSDAYIKPELTVQGVPGVASGAMSTTQCPSGITTEVCYTTNLLANQEPPIAISVISTDSGIHADKVLQIVGAGNTTITIAPDLSCAVPFTGQIELKTPTCNINIPVNAIVTQQPINGTIALIGGKWFFTPSLTAFASPNFLPESFKYVTQAANNAVVSNEATVTIAPVPNAPTLAPTTNITTTGFTVNWLSAGNTTGTKAYLVLVNGVNPLAATANPLVLFGTNSLNITGLTAGANPTVSVASCSDTKDIRKCGTPVTINQYTLPAKPTISTVTGVTGTGMTLNWSAVTGANGYAFEYLTGTTWSAVAANTATTGVRLASAVTGATTSANIIGLTPNTAYSFRMTAIDPAGVSAVSTATTSLSTLNPPPAAPTFAATTVPSTSGFTLNWIANGAGSYLVTINGVSAVRTTNSYTATGLAAGTSYAVTVSSCNSTTGLDCSATPRPLTQWTIADAPTGPAISALTPTGLTLSWAGKAATFTVERATNATFTTGLVSTAGATTTSRAITGLAANTTYYFRLVGVTPAGNSIKSAVTSVLTPLTVPLSPKRSNGQAGGAITGGLTWTASPGATAYEVMYGTSAQLTGNTGTVVTAASGAQINLVNITAGDIFMKVRAVAPTNTSDWSAQVVVTAR